MRKMKVGLIRRLRKWEVDVQTMKLQGMWMDKKGGRRGKQLDWMGKKVRW